MSTRADAARPDDDLAAFVRQVRARSKENSEAVQALHSRRLVANLVSTLRQELDSLVRVVYLLSINDMERRRHIIRRAVRGDRWPARDCDMVGLANRLHGWTKSVYAFGCGFIHLSNYHDHASRDPFVELPEQERKDILEHMRYYHGGPVGSNPTFDDLAPYFPGVFNKIAANLECYVKSLEAGGSLDDD